MHCVVDSAVRIGPGVEYPEYDPEYTCPLTVVDAKFIDHIIEIEFSKSYPGLLTMYHLYTVDVICNGLPAVDLNTLEFEHPDAKGQQKLKYVHAWVWLEWSEIQRYLFEGSELKELKQRGSFKNAAELRTWLGRFKGLDLEKWGQDKYRSVEDLFKEVEHQETYLELWGRHDGVPLLVRVAHVIQLKILSTDARQSDKFLFCTWVQDSQGRARTENRLPTKKLNIAEMPFNEAYIVGKAQEAAKEQLLYIVDVHHKIRGGQLFTRDLFSKSDVTVVSAQFIEHRSEVEESRSFKGMHTMYHLYTVDVRCTGLPLADFASLGFRRLDAASPETCKDKDFVLHYAQGLRWVSWQQVLDLMHAQKQALERQRQQIQAGVRSQLAEASSTTNTLMQYANTLQEALQHFQPSHAGVRQAVTPPVEPEPKERSPRHSLNGAARRRSGDTTRHIQKLAKSSTVNGVSNGADEVTSLQPAEQMEHFRQALRDLCRMLQSSQDTAHEELVDATKVLPPSMVSKMAENKTAAKLNEEARRTSMKRHMMQLSEQSCSCGEVFVAGMEYCCGCGKKRANLCVCGNVFPDEHRVCRHCGIEPPTALLCVCRNTLVPGLNFCPRCGRSVVEGSEDRRRLSRKTSAGKMGLDWLPELPADTRLINGSNAQATKSDAPVKLEVTGTLVFTSETSDGGLFDSENSGANDGLGD